MAIKMQAAVLAEKECEICGVWFSPNTGRQKYCPDCSARPGSRRTFMEKAYIASYMRNEA